MNKLKIDEPISIFVSKNETLTHKAFLYAKTKSSKPKYYNLKNINTGYFTINTTTTTQTLCTELINFLNCNFDNYDDCLQMEQEGMDSSVADKAIISKEIHVE